MGEERQDARTTPPGRRLTVSEAAGRLGISAEAVRSRLKRGTLRSVKDGAIMRSTGLRVFLGLRDRLAFTSETSARASPYSLDMEKAETP